jgi:hypothetical protein
VLEHVRGRKWKVQWLEPNPGLVDYLESKHIVVRWKERKAFLRDEERDRQLRADNDRLEYQEDLPLSNAVYSVFDAVGDKELSFYRGVLSGPPPAIERLKERVRHDPEKSLREPPAQRRRADHLRGAATRPLKPSHHAPSLREGGEGPRPALGRSLGPQGGRRDEDGTRKWNQRE